MEATSVQTQNFTVRPFAMTFTGVNILLVLIYGLIVSNELFYTFQD